MNQLPPVTGDRAIDYCNEQVLTPLAVDNIETAVRILIQRERADIAATLSVLGTTPHEIMSSPAYLQWRRALIAAVGNGGAFSPLAQTAYTAEQENDNVVALMARLRPLVPATWRPTPRDPEAPGPGDMTHVLAPNPWAPFIARLQAHPAKAVVRSIAADLAAAAADLNFEGLATWVECPRETQVDGDTYHGYLEQQARDPSDPTGIRPWSATLPAQPAWLPKLQGPMAAAVQAGLVAVDPFKEQRRPAADGSLKWHKPLFMKEAAECLRDVFCAQPWVQSNYPQLRARLQ